MADPKVRRPQGPNGGDTLEVASGGTISILSGGTIAPTGGQASFTAAASTSTGTGTFSTTAAQETNIQSIAKLANANAAALKGIGAMATSA